MDALLIVQTKAVEIEVGKAMDPVNQLPRVATDGLRNMFTKLSMQNELLKGGAWKKTTRPSQRRDYRCNGRGGAWCYCSEFTRRLIDLRAYHHKVHIDFSYPGTPTGNAFI